jgi:hypothetical protein
MDGASRKWDDPTTGSIGLLGHGRQVATLRHKPYSTLGLLAPAARRNTVKAAAGKAR